MGLGRYYKNAVQESIFNFTIVCIGLWINFDFIYLSVSPCYICIAQSGYVAQWGQHLLRKSSSLIGQASRGKNKIIIFYALILTEKRRRTLPRFWNGKSRDLIARPTSPVTTCANAWLSYDPVLMQRPTTTASSSWHNAFTL